LGEASTETRKIFCNTCQHLTTHLLKARFSLNEDMTEDKYEWPDAKYEREWEEDNVGIHVHRYSLWSCAGCTTPTAEWEVGTETGDPDDPSSQQSEEASISP
jgi:hypothetical protein